MSLIEFKNRILPNKDKLYRFAFRIVGDGAEAEDVVQEVFIKLWNKRQDWHIYNNIEALCMRMTKNLAIDKLRSKHRRVQALDSTLEITETSATPHQIAESQDTIAYIQRMMAELPEKQRLVMQLRDIEGMTYKEVADALDIPMAQVKVYLFRARKQIRQQLTNSESYGKQQH